MRFAVRIGALSLMTGAAGLLLTPTNAPAEDYRSLTPVRSGAMAAASMDPNDPVPQIGFDQPCSDPMACGGAPPGPYDEGPWPEDGYDHHHHGHHERHPHEILVNCARQKDGWDDERHRRVYANLQAAIDHARPNDTILILPPGQGQTCMGGVDVDKPLTITSAGADPAAIQSSLEPTWREADDQTPRHRDWEKRPPPFKAWGAEDLEGRHGSCLTGRIGLGDTLTITNIRFIARSAPGTSCVHVEAGRIEMHQVEIDARNPDPDRHRYIDPPSGTSDGAYSDGYRSWAFNVGESGELALWDSQIKTDSSGILAQRARVELHDVEIDVEEGYNGVGLALDRTDGLVESSHILGGSFGALVSAGPHGLELDHLTVDKAYLALTVFGGEQGQVRAEGVALTDSYAGLLVLHRSDAVLHSLSIDTMRNTGVTLLGGRVELRDSQIRNASTGVAIGSGDQTDWSLCARIMRSLFGYDASSRPDYADGDNLLGRSATLTNNQILNVDRGVRIGERYRVEASGNTILARKECRDGDGDSVSWERSNVCRD
jgi:hypothetical protein